MSSSSLTSYLALWREIICKPPEGTHPVNQHLDFIRNRFNELEAKGFIWSKESILDIFLQLAQPKSLHEPGPFSSIDTVDKSRCSSDEIEEVLQSEEILHNAHPLGLMDIPIEIFGKILETLDCIAKLEAKELTEKKKKRKVVITGPGDREPYYRYLYQDPPILNSIQSFSLTSREIYKRCQLLLWRKLQFPTSLPAPIDQWTKDILFKQGQHVRYLSIGLSENCSVPPDEFVEIDPFYDNLTPYKDKYHHVAWISQKNAKALINGCPNVSEVDIEYEYLAKPENVGGTEIFLLELVPILSNLKQLRHLKLKDGYQKTIMNEFPSKIIGSLPLLESLTMGGLTAPGNQRTTGENSFGSNLSKLRYLSKLELWRIEDIDEDWCLYNWPKTITTLDLHECGDLSLSSAYKIIHHIAPYLTVLRLGFAYERGGEIKEIDSRWDPQTRFSLPNLTDLELCTGDANLLDSFEECNTLNSLHWCYMTSEHCRALSRTLFKATWPQLKKLDVAPWMFLNGSDLGTQSQELEDQFLALEKYCKEAIPNPKKPIIIVTWAN
ncbi:uncharacterized protein MELLADRAFT_111497 [Melampsora larici-populina 98AG31]|uniref:F-box domain-containing protein n=1 Tax=Melampsora larici-populina (strain 98AG31 / pathotype 3-4-7) TaxID=747676 RepID=F4S3D4_MELLP|nr:uncharacterized protein MELLADRAFT_111497 [Melampsora larici-populina 98AG31]EGG00794.1 hypothetical protein MELLADRAFT_111497 [Melampsora larici-populina 98AG31]